MLRFWSKVNIPNLNACWEWQAGKFPKGYGAFYFNGKCQRANRVSWILTKGEIPKGLKVLHSCDNPPCVNPLHLSLGTTADNMKDRDQRGRHKNMKKTHCPKGHPYSGDNLYIQPSNRSRRCIECRKLSWLQAKKEKEQR